MLNDDFLKIAKNLQAPAAGTEFMGPFLYDFISSTKPRTLLEVGSGYTSLFILKALENNVKQFNLERKNLLRKTEELLDKTNGHISAKELTGKQFISTIDEWLMKSPTFANPKFYMNEYKPLLHTIDNYSFGDGSAIKLNDALDQLPALKPFLQMHQGDFRTYHEEFTKNDLCFDLAWFDCGGQLEYEHFLENYWHLLSENNSHLLMHCTLNGSHYNHVIQDLKLKQLATEFNNFELLSVLEPHKLTQGSFTVVRKTAAYKHDFIFQKPHELAEAINLFYKKHQHLNEESAIAS